MPGKSKIEWTDDTWNPVTGCTKISPGCKHCYAQAFAERWRGVKDHAYTNGFDLTLRPERLQTPLKWTTPRMVFVNSMSDLFHVDVPSDFIREVFDVMRRADWHTFQVLTKRAQRLSDAAKVIEWPSNVWAGVSVENQDAANYRIPLLLTATPPVRFLSVEPLLGPVVLGEHLTGLDWVIVGGESGPHARAMNSDWVRAIRDECQAAQTPFFFKQWGGVNKKKAGRTLDGRTWDEMPEIIDPQPTLL